MCIFNVEIREWIELFKLSEIMDDRQKQNPKIESGWKEHQPPSPPPHLL